MNHNAFFGIVLLALFPCVSMAESVDGIYACSGYFSGVPTSNQRVEVKLSLKIGKDEVYISGDRNFFGTDVINPLWDTSYKNCGMLFAPEFRFKDGTCDLMDSKGMPIVRDNGILDLATMRLWVLNLNSGGSGEFDCKKTEY